jgi:multidrug efflux pump
VFYVLLRQLTGNRPLKQHGEVPHVEAFAGAPGGTHAEPGVAPARSKGREPEHA